MQTLVDFAAVEAPYYDLVELNATVFDHVASIHVIQNVKLTMH